MDLKLSNGDSYVHRPSFRVPTGENDRVTGNSIRRKNRSSSLHGNALKISAWNNPEGMEANDLTKTKRKSQRGPGLREMLYGIAAKREKEEAAARKRQKKLAGTFHKRYTFKNLNEKFSSHIINYHMVFN